MFKFHIVIVINDDKGRFSLFSQWKNNIRQTVKFFELLSNYNNSFFIIIDKKNDSKYRRYVAALEKCLQSFESVNEWADVISFLSRLGKVNF